MLSEKKKTGGIVACACCPSYLSGQHGEALPQKKKEEKEKKKERKRKTFICNATWVGIFAFGSPEVQQLVS